MCTIVVATRRWTETPLLIAANRDERVDRPAEPPLLWRDRAPRLLAPRDSEAGGTWLGLNEHGVFAGITNRHGALLDLGRRSRGALVLDALEESTARAAAERVAAGPGDETNGFHLVLADAEESFVAWGDGVRRHLHVLAPGIHVFTERSFGAAPSSRRERLQATIDADALPGPADDAAWQAFLAHHDPNQPFESTCVHADDWKYGTRSALILRLGVAPSVSFADGPPCRAPFEDVSAALRDLLS